MYYGLSDIGKMRQENQDSFASITNKANELLHIVCDGIAGSRGGKIASRSALAYVAEKFAASPGFKSLEAAELWFEDLLKATNQYLISLTLNANNLAEMGTTLVAAYLHPTGGLVMNIGDSRASVFQAGELKALSVDHNLAQQLLDQGKISPEELVAHPQRHVLTNALGSNQSLWVDFFRVPADTELLLLSTDGLHDYVLVTAISEVLSQTHLTLATKVEELVQLANQAGGFDNVTVLLIDLKKQRGLHDVSETL